MLAEQEQRKHAERLGPADVDKLTLDKIIFLYHYVMNFRSRFSRELKTKLKSRKITEKEHEAGNEQIAVVSAILKEAKIIIDQL